MLSAIPVMLRTAAALFIALAGIVIDPAAAQPYPNRPIRIIVPTAPGGPVDAIARLVANYLVPVLGQNVIVENRGGAGNTLGSNEAARAEPDGYTLLVSSASGLVISPMLQKNVGYDPVSSFAPIALLGSNPLILVVNPSLPVASAKELVAFAADHPGKVNFSSGGIGTLPNLTGELFKARAGANVVHVPYRGGGPSIADVVAGQIQFTFEGSGVLLPLIRDGKLRAIAVTGPKRIAELPDVPTMIESGFPGFISIAWTGLFAPAATPAAIISTLNAQTNRVLKSPDLQATLAKLSIQPLGGSAQDLAQMIESDTAKWGPIVRSLNIKID